MSMNHVTRTAGAAQARWSSVRERRTDDSFVFAVRTTKIACRCGCPSRTPLREHVEFFEDFLAAQRAGYRACKRCAPDRDAPNAELAASIDRACSALAASNPPSLESLALELGMSRSHFQRAFRTVTGVTPARYRRALRDARFRALLASGERVTDAIFEAGYGSASSAYARSEIGHLRYAFGDSPLGAVLVAASEDGIAAIELGDTNDDALAELRAHFRRCELRRDDAGLQKELAAVLALIDDPNAPVALRLDLRGSAFTRNVWNVLQATAPGERITYAQLARAAGAPGAARAAGTACGANRLAVVIPCHRAVRTGGDLAGYRWGIERKRALLERERR